MTLFFSFPPPTRKEQVTAVPKKKNILLDKLKESLASVLPITGIVLLLTSTIAPLPVGSMMAFVIGAIMLIFGMALFTLGTEMAMTPLGERVGVVMTKSRNLKIIIPVCFAIGVMITMSEPDLTVLATQVPSIPNMAIILSVAVGVGAFLVVALLRIVIGIRLSNMLVAFYALVFILAFFAPNEFLAVAFDSGGVTTGPMTVPFIMALGVGISSIRSDRHAENDSFGMVALCSVGPILAVLVLSLIYRPGESLYTPAAVPEKEAPADLHGNSLLVVEDNELNMDIVEFMLKSTGAEVVKAFDGESAVRAFTADPAGYDAILMDLMMPVMDGYAAAKAIRASGQTRAGTVPIIAMSANAYAEDVKKCLDSGMNAHISKPLFKDVMLRTIARFV